MPLDTLAFQYLAGYLTPAAFTTEVLSKLVGVMIVWYLLKLRMERSARRPDASSLHGAGSGMRWIWRRRSR